MRSTEEWDTGVWQLILHKTVCEGCERKAEDLDDDGYCEDCVIEIGISHAEANNDRD